MKGWDVTVATTVAQAMQFLALRPRFVVLDLMLPDGPGEAVLAKIRADGDPICVAVTTGVIDPDRLEQVWALRPNCVIRKPIDLPELLRGLIPLS